MKTTWEAVCPDIQCDGCSNAIKRSLGKLEGIQNVEVDVSAKRVKVEYATEQVSEAALRERLAIAGFPSQ
jgi:copper chaperone CopZ